MGDKITLGVDCKGEWIESNKRYIWRWKGKQMAETILMSVHRDITYDDFASKIITDCELNCELSDIAITYMHSCGEKQKVGPFRIKNQSSLRVYLDDEGRPVLRVYVVERVIENHNTSQNQQVLSEESSQEIVGEQTPTLEVAGDTLIPQSILNHVQDDETGFYDGMTFKNKQDLDIALKIACVKKDFRFKKVKNSRLVYSVRCVHRECKWWLRAVKLKSCERFYIRKYNKFHTCGSEHRTSHNPHATAKVIGAYFKDKFPEGKGPSTKDMKTSVHVELGCKVSYWKLWKGSGIAKSLIRGTHEHGYAILDAYSYMLRTVNPTTKTTLKLDENGKFKYFFVAIGAWILGFRHMRKVIAVDGTFLKGKYGGVLLSAVAQDAENHIFPVAFCVVDSECDASYRYFFEQMSSFVDDTPELCIISDRHASIKKMVSIVYPSAHYGCCMWHLGENIRKDFHNGRIIYHFYKAAQAYNKDEFNDHFNQIKDMVPEAAAHLEHVGFHRWSRAFFPGNRFNIMTSNIAESINALFVDEREFPISALFDAISKIFAEKFHQRRMEFLNAPTIFVPSIESVIAKNIDLGNKLLVHQMANYRYVISGHDEVATVDLHYKSCSCRVFDLEKIPCPHAMAALRSQYGEDYGRRIYEYSSPYYKVETYLFAYLEEIKPVPPEKYWEIPMEILERKILPPYVEPGKLGRKAKKRRKSIGESFPSKKNKCSICKRVGHKKTTCPERNAP